MAGVTSGMGRYKWAGALLVAVFLLLAPFIYYTFTAAQASRADTTRRTFLALSLIGTDITESLGTLDPILENVVPAPAFPTTDQATKDSKTAGPLREMDLSARNELYRAYWTESGRFGDAWKTWTGRFTKFNDLKTTQSYRNIQVFPLPWMAILKAGEKGKAKISKPSSPLLSQTSEHMDACQNHFGYFLIAKFGAKVTVLDCREPRTFKEGSNAATACGTVASSRSDCHRLRLGATLPLESLVDSSYANGLVDDIAIADSSGRILFQTDRQPHARIVNIGYLLHPQASPDKKTDTGQKDSQITLPVNSRSSVFTTDLAGDEYRIFIQEQTLSHPVALIVEDKPVLKDGEVFYVVGIKKKEGMLADVSGTHIGVTGLVLGLLILLVVSIPVIKIRLVGPEEKLRMSDAFLYFGSIVLVASGFTILVLNMTAYQSLHGQMQKTAEILAGRIRHAFQTEIQNSLADLTKRLADPHGPFCGPAGGKPGADCLPLRQIVNNDGVYPPFQILTPMDADGNVVAQQVTFRERIDGAVNLGNRVYFQKARGGSLWKIHNVAGAEKSGLDRFYLERVRLRSTGEKLSILAVSLGKNCSKLEEIASGEETLIDKCKEKTQVVGYVKSFLSTRSPVLPPFFGFAIFDDDSGRVFYHSDDSRSLLENFYLEFSDADRIRAAAISGHSGSFTGEYRGKRQGLQILPLNDLPWSVAVFYDREPLQTVLFETALVAITAMLGFTVLLFVFVIIRHYVSSIPRWRFLYLSPSQTQTYIYVSLVFTVFAIFTLCANAFLEVPAVRLPFLEPLGLAGFALVTGPFLVLPLVYLTLNENHRSGRPRSILKRLEVGLAQVSLVLAMTLTTAVLFSACWQPSLLSGGEYWLLVGLFFLWLLTIGGSLNLLTDSADIVRRSLNHVVAWRGGASVRMSRIAFTIMGVSVLLPLAVVPTAILYREAFIVNSDNLTTIGYADLSHQYYTRYRLLQADVARINPSAFAGAGAALIKVPPHAGGFYASSKYLFPQSDGEFDVQADRALLNPENVSVLRRADVAGRPQNCISPSPVRLTSWLVGMLPGFGEVTAKLRTFLPPSDEAHGKMQTGACWRLDTGRETVQFHPTPSGARDADTNGPQTRLGVKAPAGPIEWALIILMIAVFTFIVWKVIRLAMTRLLSFDIAFQAPFFPKVTQNGETPDALLIEDWAQDVRGLEEAGDVEGGNAAPSDARERTTHVFIRLPRSQCQHLYQAIRATAVVSSTEVPFPSEDHAPPPAGRHDILVIEDFHLILGSDQQLQTVADVIDQRQRLGLTTIILTEIYPIEAILYPVEFPGFDQRKEIPPPRLSSQWLSILNNANTRFWPLPQTLRAASKAPNWQRSLSEETSAFHDLEEIHNRLLKQGEWASGDGRDGMVDRDDLVELVRQHARSYYWSLWRLCSKRERIALYHLAQGFLVNPVQSATLQHLLERGLLRKDPAIRLPNESFKSFVLTAEPQETFAAWEKDIKDSTWSFVRIPLLAFILLLAIGVISMGQETTSYVIALLGGTGALAPMLVRLVTSVAAGRGKV